MTTLAVANETELETDGQKAMYATGVYTVQNLRKQGFEVDIPAFMEGVKDALAGNKPQISEKEVLDAIENIKKQILAKQKAMAAKQGTLVE